MFNQAGRSPVIIVVDDEPDIVLILHRLVRDLLTGYDILNAYSGAEVLAQLELRPVPLVLTDYYMPGMNGLQLTAAIKERSPASRVALITAYASTELQRKALTQGVDDYLPKPFAIDALEHIVRSALQNYEQHVLQQRTCANHQH